MSLADKAHFVFKEHFILLSHQRNWRSGSTHTY